MSALSIRYCFIDVLTTTLINLVIDSHILVWFIILDCLSQAIRQCTKDNGWGYHMVELRHEPFNLDQCHVLLKLVSYESEPDQFRADKGPSRNRERAFSPDVVHPSTAWGIY